MWGLDVIVNYVGIANEDVTKENAIFLVCLGIVLTWVQLVVPFDIASDVLSQITELKESLAAFDVFG